MVKQRTLESLIDELAERDPLTKRIEPGGADLSGQLTTALVGKMSQFSNLEEIILSYNYLTGEIPEALGELTGLRVLNLSSNLLSGGIPSALGKLVNLEWLTLNKNQLTGQIPFYLGYLKNLQWLSLADNHLTGHLPGAALGNQLTGTVYLPTSSQLQVVLLDPHNLRVMK